MYDLWSTILPSWNVLHISYIKPKSHYMVSRPDFVNMSITRPGNVNISNSRPKPWRAVKWNSRPVFCNMLEIPGLEFCTHLQTGFCPPKWSLFALNFSQHDTLITFYHVHLSSNVSNHLHLDPNSVLRNILPTFKKGTVICARFQAWNRILARFQAWNREMSHSKPGIYL